jgi:hypothetical protein
LSPRGNVHPFAHPQGWTLYCLEEWRGEQRISPPGDNFTPPQGTKFTPGEHFRHWGQSLPIGAKLRIGLWRRGLVVVSPPSSDETGAMGREIESHQGMHRVGSFKKRKSESILNGVAWYVCATYEPNL